METWNRPLADRLPRLVAGRAPLRLGDLPTPVERLSGLEAMGVGAGRALFVKRDDRSSAIYGGNKVRKLEFLLGEALAAGCTTLLTMGGSGSNHLLATALHGRRLGLRTVGVVFPQPDSQAVQRNQAGYRAAGVELVPVRSKFLLVPGVARTLLRLRLRGERVRLVPGGGSSALGALGFVNAGLELADDVRAGRLPEPQAVFVPYGTGGTAAGLALGLQLAGLHGRVVAVRVIDRLLANRPRLQALVRAIAAEMRAHGDGLRLAGRAGANLEIRHGYIGPGYGAPTEAGTAAVALFAERAGLTLETTYTGKAAAALLDEARHAGGALLFWHTYSSADPAAWEGPAP